MQAVFMIIYLTQDENRCNDGGKAKKTASQSTGMNDNEFYKQ